MNSNQKIHCGVDVSKKHLDAFCKHHARRRSVDETSRSPPFLFLNRPEDTNGWLHGI